jgi:short subunit dehydrogenase-like uncharacterized protein
MGGRNRTKLEALRADLGPQAANLERVLGDDDDEAFLDTVAARARVVCSTVGPYAVYGSCGWPPARSTPPTTAT